MPVTAETVAQIVSDAGGELIGRTRLQKVTYLLAITGQEDAPSFVYKHYGPYSEQVASAVHEAALKGLISEHKNRAHWGGMYSIFRTEHDIPRSADINRVNFVKIAAKADAIELELAATAVFLVLSEDYPNAWEETEIRKPEKADGGRLDRAKELYAKLSAIPSRIRLPDIR
jgi:uncharacterized protein